MTDATSALGDPAARAVARIVVALTTLLALVAAGPAGADYSSKTRASWAPNAVVYALAVQGDHLYLGGDFTALRNVSTGETVARSRLARISLSTGELDRSWTASANSTVRAMEVSSDGSRLFVGGAFGNINGQSRTRLAAVTTASGTLVPGWNASASSTVRSLFVLRGLLYVGGHFTNMNGSTRRRAGAVTESTGSLSGYAPDVNGPVWATSPSADGTTVLLGGRFTAIGGRARNYLGSVNPTTGAVTSWAPPLTCTSTTNPCTVLDLVAKDGSVYAAITGPGGRVTAFDASTGAIRWNARGDGDVQTVAVDDDLVYAGGHFSPSFGGGTRHMLAAVRQTTGALDPDFAPVMSKPHPGTWDLVATPSHLVAAGDFTNVSGTGQSRLAVFPVIDPTGSTTETALSRSSVWRYLSAPPPDGWHAYSFADATWATGTAQLGFGDGDEATVVPRSVALYVRRAFSVSSVSTVSRVNLRLLRDDGAVVYLNGTEVARSNMPAGAISHSTPASSTVSRTAESTYFSIDLPPNLLREGDNVLAVEVHQVSSASSDMSFDAEIVLTR